MELTFQAAALCVTAALGAVFLKRGTPELGLLLSLAAAGAVLGLLLSRGREAAGLLDRLLEGTELDRELFAPLVKIVGISLVSRLGADLCRDGGQSALASLVELCGTCCALLAAAPLLTAAVRLFGGWLL